MSTKCPNAEFNNFVNKRVNIQASSGSFYLGKISGYDDFGIHFMPEDKQLSETFITWGDIKKVILVEGKDTYNTIS